jgi:outer membrane protein assembly factor BamB
MRNYGSRGLRCWDAAFLSIFFAQVISAENGSEWRGSRGDGIVHETGFPVEWSSEKNLLWESELPAPGNSTPVIAGDKVFLTCANVDGTERSTLAFDRKDGRLLWSNTIPYELDDPTHATNPWCAASPATDGEAVYVWNGSAGATAYDMDGKELWHRNLGVFTHQWGHASSPRVYKDTVIYFGSPGHRVLLIALNKRTGETVWERNLDDLASPPQDLRGSFATPFFWQNKSRLELLLPLPGYLASFAPDTGDELWRCDGLGELTYADAMVGPDVILAFSGFRGPAIGMRHPDPDEEGNLTETHRIWKNDTVIQRVGTGIIIGDQFYMCGRKGELHSGNIYTGETVWIENLRQQAWGSIIQSDELLFLMDQASVTHVFKPGDSFQPVRQNAMRPKERTNSTPVFSGKTVYLRTYDRLYAIGTR